MTPVSSRARSDLSRDRKSPMDTAHRQRGRRERRSSPAGYRADLNESMAGPFGKSGFRKRRRNRDCWTAAVAGPCAALSGGGGDRVGLAGGLED